MDAPPPLPPRSPRPPLPAPSASSIYTAFRQAGEIRLLIIHPATALDAPLVCSLEHTSLATPPRYEAVSYCWGTKGTGGFVFLNGRSFGIYENAEVALRRLRLLSETRRVWMDALCINQDDVAEKNVQIPVMHRIYEQADRVLVWLGETKDNMLATILSTHKQDRSDYMNDFIFCSKVWFRDGAAHQLLPNLRVNFHNSYLVEEMKSGEVRELLSRPWWTRVWILQEVVVAKEVVFLCGSELFEWDMMRKLINASAADCSLGETYNLLRCPEEPEIHARFHVIDQLRKVRCQNPEQIQPTEVLFNCRGLLCTDHRDRIFAFLGLLPDRIRSLTVPDYGAPPAHTYTKFARKLISGTTSLDILNCVREWRGVSLQTTPTFAYNCFDQAKYHDIDALIQRGAKSKPSHGWAPLPTGWERVSQGESCYFYDHNSGNKSDFSPLKTLSPREAHHPTEFRICPEGWTKTWDNLGRTVLRYDPDVQAQQQRELLSDLLSRLGLANLPSWVPNWASRTDRDPSLLLSWEQGGCRYDACASTPAQIHAFGDMHTLGLEGFLFDEVAVMAEAYHPETNLVPLWRREGDVREMWVTMGTATVPDCPYQSLAGGRLEAVLRTHIADYVGQEAATEPYLSLVKDWFCAKQWFYEGHDTSYMANMRTRSAWSILGKSAKQQFRAGMKAGNSDPNMDWDVEFRLCAQRIHRSTAHRAMFVTRKGYVGLAPWNARTGDWVCVLNGGKTPFLLRPSPGTRHVSLVGDAYVHGIMAGEGISLGVPAQIFHLR